MPHKILPHSIIFKTAPPTLPLEKRAPISRAAYDLAQQFQVQQLGASGQSRRSRESIRQQSQEFIANLDILKNQIISITSQVMQNPTDISLITEIREISLIIRKLLLDLPTVSIEKISSYNSAALFDGLNSDLHNYLGLEIKLTRIMIHQQTSEKTPEIRNHIVRATPNLSEDQIHRSMVLSLNNANSERLISELRGPLNLYLENLIETKETCSIKNKRKLENAVGKCLERITDIQHALKNYTELESIINLNDGFFSSQRPIINELLEKADIYKQQITNLQGQQFIRIKMTEGQIIDYQEDQEHTKDFRHLTDLLPLIEQFGELGVSALAYLIESDIESKTPLAEEQQLLELLNDLAYFSGKFSWATRELFVLEGWKDLLDRTESPKNQLQHQSIPCVESGTVELEQQVQNFTIGDALLNSAEATDENPNGTNRKAIATLEKCKELLALNPLEILASVKKNPGFFSPFTVQQTYALFRSEAQKILDSYNLIKPKGERYISSGNVDSSIKESLAETLEKLSGHVASLDLEGKYSLTDDFKFTQLKIHRTPRVESWRTLFNNGQLESIVFKGKLRSDHSVDHLYEFELVPSQNQAGDGFPSVWLHVHLKKNVLTAQQWQSLESADIKAAHLKPNHARNLGCRWLEEQRMRGNYDAVIERSKVNVDFIKLIADQSVISAASASKTIKGKNKIRKKK